MNVFTVFWYWMSIWTFAFLLGIDIARKPKPFLSWYKKKKTLSSDILPFKGEKVFPRYMFNAVNIIGYVKSKLSVLFDPINRDVVYYQ